MTFRTLIRRGLRFHWRAHLGVVLGAAVGSAALIGALVVGDSVRESLREQALKRLGQTAHVSGGSQIGFALQTPDRFFTDMLADRMIMPVAGWEFPTGIVSSFEMGQPIQTLMLTGVGAREDGVARANNIQLIGAASGPSQSELWFYHSFGLGTNDQIKPGTVWVNNALAKQLRLSTGDRLILRIPKRLGTAGDVSISPRNDQSVALRVTVDRILPASRFSLADFNLRATQTPALNVFVNFGDLQRAAGLEGRVNTLLQTPLYSHNKRLHDPILLWLPPGLRYRVMRFLYPLSFAPSGFAIAKLQELLRQNWKLPDTEANLRPSPDRTHLGLVSRRVFLDPPLVSAALAANTNSQPVLTYLVNLLRFGTNTTPYSMVTAAGPPWTPADLRDDEIILSQWLAEDLQVKPGDEVALTYFDPESGARLTERTNPFRVHAVVPMEMPWADRTLMPDFPGIEKAESTSEWDAGFPLVHKIRQKDEDYWKKYRGTPKAFITLAAGKKMWGNRFGELTAIRFPIPTNATPAPGERERRSQSQSELKAADGSTASERPRGEQWLSPLPGGEGQGEGERKTQTTQSEPPQVVSYKEALEKRILANLKPEELGLRFEPVREQALKAAEQSQDFGGLFLGFSFFLILAALLLMAMLFQFGLEQRTAEIGTLLALGFTPKQVRRLLLGEGVALAFLGGVLGALGGTVYAQAMLHGLTTVWRDAVGASALSFHATPQTLAIGLCASTAISAVTIGLALRKFVRRPATQLLTGEVHSPEVEVRSRGRLIGLGALAGAFGLAGWMVAKGDTANAGAFFGAGALVLVAGLSFLSAWLTGMERRPAVRRVSYGSNTCQNPGSETGAPITLSVLAVHGCARRRTRSLATVVMLACGSFLIVSIGVFRLDANRDAAEHSSGTGGFALIGESTMPVVQDLNSQSGRDFFALNARALEGVRFVPFRVREGDEASCLNLNRAQRPRLLGVKAEMLEGRFSLAKGSGWRSLINVRLQPGAPAYRGVGNRLNGLPQGTTDNTGRKPGVNVNEIPAIGDANSIHWAMHKKVGDTIDYVDERGQPFKVRIVGAVANSILQGQLILDEAEFVKRFPGESGYRMFLMDAPSNAVSQVSATLSRALQDVGLELTPTAQRLAQFNAVQNTYLGTFQVLGGLGLLLGSVGLGIVVLRNVLERRGELAVLLAVGFRARLVERLVLIEHGALLALGLALGIAAAAVAVLPALLSPAAQLPYASLALALGAVLINGALWTWVAARAALRGDLLAALRNE
jgi:ABC-type antimicrobial peptide transport system permease subunit